MLSYKWPVLAEWEQLDATGGRRAIVEQEVIHPAPKSGATDGELSNEMEFRRGPLNAAI
jgi:hypothetical protein